MGVSTVKQRYIKLFENEIPDKFEIPVIDISFRPVIGDFSSEVKHSNPAEFMSKIIYIIKHYISKHKNEVFSFSGEARENEDYSDEKPTTRIKIYQKIISKFINAKNMIRLPNKLLFFSESKQLKELDLITKVDKKSISKNKNKFIKLDYDYFGGAFIKDIIDYDLNELKQFFISELEINENQVFDIFIVNDKKYAFIQQDKNFEKGFLIFLVYFQKENYLQSKTLEKYNLENSDFVKKLNSKGKLEKEI